MKIQIKSDDILSLRRKVCLVKMLKLRVFAIALAAIVVTSLSQSTLAFYSVIGTATNVVTSGDIRLVIHETTGDGSPYPKDGVYVIPGQIVSKRVTIENDCDHPFYLRVKLVDKIDREGLSIEDCLGVDINENAWTVRDDGYIYYNKALDSHLVTEPVFTQVEIIGDKVDKSYIGAVLSLTVSAYAVQQENNPAEHPWDASGWPAAE